MIDAITALRDLQTIAYLIGGFFLGTALIMAGFQCSKPSKHWRKVQRRPWD